MPHFYIHTLGCQMNVYDSERLAQVLQTAGWKPVPEPEQAELLILNTCTVRQLAEDKAFSLLGRWSKQKISHPDLVIGMVGCLAQYLGTKVFSRVPNIDFLAGPRALHRVPELAEQAKQKKHIADLDLQKYDTRPNRYSDISAISAYVSVMDGCNQFCSYCAVPMARGREVSRPISDILTEIKNRLHSGTKEIILLGQNINHYGWDLTGKIDLIGLLYRVAEIPDLLRLRFITSHPRNFDKKLILAMKEIPQVCEALHLPLQSGSNTILKAMRRGYSREEYLNLVGELRSAIPSLALSTDIMVGFPGESEVDFQATLDIVRQIGFTMVYSFKFSPRPGTMAAQLPDAIETSIKEERLTRLFQEVDYHASKAKEAMLGTQVKVLLEQFDPKTHHRLQGRTRTNHIVHLKGPSSWIGNEVEVKVVDTGKWSVTGEALDYF